MKRPIIEKPSGKIARDATFYCKFGNVLDTYLGFNQLGDYRNFPPARDREWALFTSPHYIKHKMPESAGPAWSHYEFTPPESLLSQFSPDLQIIGSGSDGDIPDIDSWPPWSITSEFAKNVLEQIFPNGSIFVPVQILDSNGQSISKKYYYWIVKNRLCFDDSKALEQVQKMTFRFPGSFSNHALSWQLANNSALRAYLMDFPFWGISQMYMNVAFNKQCFETLKAERVTGLVENTADFAADRNYFESIGHIF